MIREGYIWFLQIVTGILLIIFLGIHVIGEHFFDTDVLRWAVLFIIFVAVALIHGLIGLRNIITETTVGRKYQGVVVVLIILVGLAFFSLAVYVQIIGK